MTTLEIVLNMLAEATTTELTKTKNPQGLTANKQVAREGGSIAGDARKSIEAKTGQSVISASNALDFGRLIGEVEKKRENKEEEK